MPALAGIRAGLVANLTPLATTYQGMQILPYIVSLPTLPTIWVKPTPDAVTDYHQTFNTMGETQQITWYITVQAWVAAGGDIAAQQLLDELLDISGPHSVRAAIESDPTLGGASETLIVRRCSSYQEYLRSDGVPCLGASWDVEVS